MDKRHALSVWNQYIIGGKLHTCSAAAPGRAVRDLTVEEEKNWAMAYLLMQAYQKERAEVCEGIKAPYSS